MKLTKRVWAQQGYMLVEPADECGHEYWIDHRGRIGVEHDSGEISWLQVREEADGMSIVQTSEALDTVQLAIDDLRTYGIAGNSH